MAAKGRRRFGRVRQLPSGRWQARVPDPSRPGRLIAAPTTFATEVDADRWLNAQETHQAEGRWVDPSAGCVTLTAYADDWLEQRPDLRLRTRETYRGLLDLHILPTLGATDLARLTPAAVRRWHARLGGPDGPGDSTAAKAYRLLRTITKTAVADELIVKSPCVVKGAGVEHAPERPIASMAEVEAMAEAMPERWRPIVLLAAFCTGRVGELLALRRRDLDLLHAEVRVERNLQRLAKGGPVFGPPKTEAGRRTPAIPPHLVEALATHLDAYVAPEPDALVFTGAEGGIVRTAALYQAWKAARASIGRPELHLHDLRHSGLTWRATLGATTAELMEAGGHSSPDAALRYQHSTADRQRAMADMLSDVRRQSDVVPLRPAVEGRRGT